MLLPVLGTITIPLDKAENSKAENPGLSVTNVPGAVVAAPIGGRLVGRYISAERLATAVQIAAAARIAARIVSNARQSSG